MALILATTIVGTSSFILASSLSRNNNFVDFIINWFTLFFAQVVIVTLGLGIISRLFLYNVVACHILVMFVAIFFLGRHNYFKSNKPDILFIFENKPLLIALGLFLGFFLVKFGLNLFNPSVYADVMQYHLPFPASWTKYGNLINPIVIFDKNNPNILNALSYFPINAEIFFFWFMLPLKNAFLADVGQAPFYIIGILAIYSILKKLSVDRKTALLLGLIWALIPNILKQMEYGALVDVICAVIFLVVLNNLVNLYLKPSLAYAALFGISCGLFIGIKAIDIFWLMSLILPFLYVLNGIQKQRGRPYFIKTIFIIIAGIFVFSSFSYLRNFMLTGNIFYPIEFKLLGKVIMPGAIDKETYSRFLVPWEEFKLRNMFFGEGLGLQFLALIFPGTIIPWLFFKYFKGNKTGKLFYFFLFLVPPIMFMLFIFYIKAYWIRYFFPYLGAGLICAALFLYPYKWGRNYLFWVSLISVFSSAAEMSGHLELIISLALSFLLFTFMFLFGRRALTFFSRHLYPGLTIIFLGFCLFLFFANNWYDHNEFKRYPHLFSRKERAESQTGLSWQWINERSNKGMRIAYTGRPESYPLYGTRLKNDIFYISVNDKPSIPHYYADGDYRKEQNFDRWLKNLRQANIEMLVVYQLHESEVFPIEETWAKKHPEIFEQAFQNSNSRIYYLRK